MLCYHHKLLNSDTTKYAFFDLFPCGIFKKNWCQIRQDGKIIASKHVGDMRNVVSINYRIVQLLVLHA